MVELAVLQQRVAHWAAARVVPGLCAGLAMGFLLVTGVARASPMIYTATIVTDIKIGANSYHNARVSVVFDGDTNDITAVVDGSGTAIPSTFCTNNGGAGYFSYITKGSASVRVTAKGRTFVAHLAPGQVFVALDSCNGGIGFGAFTGPNGLEPAYPVAFTLGTAMSSAIYAGLTVAGSMSGNAWSCIGYPPTGAGALPGNGCMAPDNYPLHSDAGDLYFYQPYTAISNSDGTVVGNHVGALNRGTFTIAPPPGESED